ncbi:uncharacterized protein LOC126662130 [Mercurialis annua]|uniref:uncharacterized protein LOC126662130 n=1 Tax=Mercurialis annua TaxID=3986 RepID=UPI00215F7B5F|nr:uncharacterized protein LOC126662130 [Mercurialis annua]
MHNPQSLIYQVYQSKYFPTTTILEGKLSGRPSWGWRSLLWGRELLIQGLRWQINDGSTLNYFKEPWIPGNYPFLPKARTTQQQTTGVISDLINQTTRNWKTSMILEIFAQDDARTILALPLSYWPHPDKLIWHHTRDGNYTVKSGYHIAHNKGLREYQSTIPHLSKPDWKLLWGLQIPNKIKVFIWRCLHEGLPTGMALHQRLLLPPNCKFCEETESLTHLLLSCPFARQVWFQGPLNFRSDWDTFPSFSLHWKHTTSQLQNLASETQALPLYCFTLWHIWKARNSRIFKDNLPTIEGTIRSIIQDAEEFEQSLIPMHNVAPPNNPYQSNIQDIPTGFIKLNYDAAVHKQRKQGFAGIVTMDEHRRIQGKFSTTFCFIWDPGILEMMALREAMNWALSRGWTKAIFEGDALQISTIINSQKCSIASLQGICADIWRLLNSFTSAVIQSVPRNQNQEAHNWVQEVKRRIL